MNEDNLAISRAEAEYRKANKAVLRWKALAAKKADAALRAEMLAGKTKCNCGDPRHSPDCAINLRWDDLRVDFESDREDEVE